MPTLTEAKFWEGLEERIGHGVPQPVRDFHPTGRRLVVLRRPADKQYKDLIWIPDNSKSPLHQGWIISQSEWVGRDLDEYAIGASIGVGDCVLWGQFSGMSLMTTQAQSEFGDDGDEFLVINEKDIIGIIHE